ncbi:MAG: NAD-dependent epimerase/dehydratase family protein [Pelagibacteraceae bacterium TMED247]|nr:ligand-binding protein, RmlD family [Candidatus Pelagibacter sp.]RPG05589.1 MAG: NAD-dependent epimerase/dehydratase family protein [Pelagibacteraceae bacterium TMED247]|tara:strand:+ start:4433 stop:5125 length:693 start_codon:yes stop_codon:yes gene_type:complete
MKKIVITGGTGRFGKILKKIKTNYNIFYPNKKKLDITNYRKTKSYLKKIKPKIVIHLAGLSRPMWIHKKNISKSIDLNIIGTANLVRACSAQNIKIIYFSTSYVYPGKKGNYKESDPVLPWNNYSWSKLGGECAVQMYKNSLILRACMTEKPFIHKNAYSNVKLNFIFHEDMAKLLLKVINKKGILNIGGETKTAFEFAKKYNSNVKKIKSKGEFPLNPYMNLNKLKKII